MERIFFIVVKELGGFEVKKLRSYGVKELSQMPLHFEELRKEAKCIGDVRLIG